MTGLLNGSLSCLALDTSKSTPLLTNLKIAKQKRNNAIGTHQTTNRPFSPTPTYLPTMKLSNTFAAALVAVLISPTIASAKKPGKNKGKLTETLITVYIATDEALGGSESPDSLALAFLEDDLTYSFNKVQEQEGSDLHGDSSHYLGKAQTSEDPGGDVLFPELSKSLGGSGLGYYQG
jgi:hypothetical protein